MNIMQTRRQLVLGIALLVLLGAAIYGFINKPTVSEPDKDRDYEGLILINDISMPDEIRTYFEQRIAVSRSSIATQVALGAEPDLELLFALAWDLNATGDLVGAREAYEDFLELNPLHYTAWNNYGNVLQLMGDIDPAEEAYRQALELYQSEEYFRDYVKLLQDNANGERDEDIKALLEQSVEVLGQTSWNMVELAEWHLTHGDCDSALNHYGVAKALDPDGESLSMSIAEANEICK